MNSGQIALNVLLTVAVGVLGMFLALEQSDLTQYQQELHDSQIRIQQLEGHENDLIKLRGDLVNLNRQIDTLQRFLVPSSQQ